MDEFTLTPIPRSTLIAQGKGGVGKSTIAVNFAFAEALHNTSGRVVLVDLDPQGSASKTLVGPTGCELDGGEAFSRALKIAALGDGVEKIDLHPTIIPNLLVLAGGNALNKAESIVRAEYGEEKLLLGLGKALHSTMSALNDGNTSFLIDTPPVSRLGLGEVSLLVAEWLVAPTTTSHDDTQALETLGEKLAEVKSMIKFAGVLINKHSLSETRLLADAKKRITTTYGDSVPVFRTIIRNGSAAKAMATREGFPEILLSVKAEELLAGISIAEMIRGKAPRVPQNVRQMASDYQDAFNEFNDLRKG